MPLDPQVRQHLDSLVRAGLPPFNELSPVEARQQMTQGTRALGKSEPVHLVDDRTVPGPAGPIPIRVFKPSDEPLPVVVFFHGGGWVVGGIESHDGYCRALANAADAIIASVDYRLAPEHQFPAAAEDAYEATRWVYENAGAIGGRADAIVVAGDSAGGNLAAVASLMARDRGGPQIGLQALIYPITDHSFNTKSYLDFADGYFLTRDAMIWFWDHYCPSDAERNHPHASPLRAEKARDLPPALIITAQYDPLRDEGEAYAEKLRKAGVPVTLTRYDGMIHGFVRRLNHFDQARVALNEVAAAIKGWFE